MSNAEPEGFAVRPATLDDVPAIYGLLQSHERALYGSTDKILAYVQATYCEPSLDFTGDTCLVFDRAGRLVGSMLLEQSRYANFGVTVYVFPPEPDSGEVMRQITMNNTLQTYIIENEHNIPLCITCTEPTAASLLLAHRQKRSSVGIQTRA